ncbi:MAG: hypothetical protein VXW22_02315 [Pseudomonadota bacterium]|nr:hypothetical protein [Pseudomonadota bacterium]
MIDTKPAIRGIENVASTAKDMASAIAKLSEDHGVTAEFEGTTGGGHQRVVLRWNGEARKMTFASTPSCGRAGKNNLSIAKRLMSDMGVDVRSAKEKKMDKTVLGSFTAPKPSREFLKYKEKNPSLRSTPRRFIRDRDEFIAGCMSEGAKGRQIHEALKAAGWDVKLQAIYGRMHTLEKKGAVVPAEELLEPQTSSDPGDLAEAAPAPAPEPISRNIEVDDFAMDLALAIAPVIRKYIRKEVVSMLRSVEE